MIKNILVPIDFSICSMQALRMACEYAHKHEASIEIFHVSHYDVMADLNPDIPFLDAIKEKIHDKTQFVLSQYGLTNKYKITVVKGTTEDEIVKASESVDVDLIIMGTVGESNVSNAIFGSVTSSIIKEAKCAVIAIPEVVESMDIQKVLLCFDYQAMEEPEELKVLIDMINVYQAKLKVLFINADGHQMTPDDQYNVSHLKHNLEEVEHHFMYKREEGSVAESIMKYAKKHQYDMVAVVPRKHGFIYSLFNESVSKKLVLKSELPTLVFHA